MFIVRKRTGLFAYRDRCPHYATELPWKRDAYLTAGGDQIECSLHGARFRIEDGHCLIGPCLGQGLEPVHIAEQDGVIWIDRAEIPRLAT